MKNRLGFVSNSSSSSFVLAGYLFKDDELTREQIEDYEDIYSVHEGGEQGVNDGEIAIGWRIAEGDECDFDSCITTVKELEDKLDSLKKVFPDKELKIIAGTRLC
jgi:hypothetical protein